MLRNANAISLFLTVLASNLVIQISCQEICPDCVVTLNETFRDVAFFNFDRNAPSSGVCVAGENKVNFTHFGGDYNVSKNACCCLQLPPSDPYDCSVAHPVICPPIPTIGADELISDYYGRIGQALPNAPVNGCCPPGMFKWVFDKAFIGTTQNICTCFTNNNFLTKPQICL